MLDIFNLGVSLPKRKMGQYSWTFYGIGGVGKSSLVAQFPNVLFFQFELGQNALTIKGVPINSWDDFKKYIKQLQKGIKEGKKMPYQNFAIDTADVAWKYVIAYVCRQNGWASPSDGGHSGWSVVATEWFSTLDELMKLASEDEPSTIINILHEKDKEFKPNGREKYNKTVLNVPDGGRAVVYDKVDLVVHCGMDFYKSGTGEHKTRRVMRFRDNGEVEAKSRLNKMPDTLEFGDNGAETFKRLKAAFDKAVTEEFGEEGDTPPVKKESPPATDTSKEDEAEAKAKKDAEAKAKKEEEAKAKAAADKKAKAEADKKAKDAEQAKTESDAQAKSEADSQKAEQVEEKNEEPPAAPSESGEKTLAQLVKEVEVKFMELYKSGAKSPTELVALVTEHTGKARVTEIDDADKAKALLIALAG